VCNVEILRSGVEHNTTRGVEEHKKTQGRKVSRHERALDRGEGLQTHLEKCNFLLLLEECSGQSVSFVLYSRVFLCCCSSFSRCVLNSRTEVKIGEILAKLINLILDEEKISTV
jgi:hypothetical protein